MRINVFLKSCLYMATPLLLLSSCINSDYDLSDIDTNARVEVNDLVIPIKIEPVTLDDMLDIDDSRIEKIVLNGKEVYAVVEKGSFESGDININPMSINKPSMPTINDHLNVEVKDQMNQIPTALDNIKFGELESKIEEYNQYLPADQKIVLDKNMELVHFNIPDKHQTIEFKAENLDHAIADIDSIGVDTEFNVSVEFPGMNGIATNFRVHNLKVQLPAGLVATVTSGNNCTYDYKTGMLTCDNIDAGDDLKVEINLHVKGIKREVAGATFKDHNFQFKKDVYATGYMDLFLEDINETLTVGELRNLSDVVYKVNARFNEDIHVNTFTGFIDYIVESPKIDPIDLSDLPEALTQAGTRLEMTNPQIYLDVKNPIFDKADDKGIHPSATLILKPDLYNDANLTEEITLDKQESMFCLSPHNPAEMGETFYKDADDKDYDFTNATWQSFADLGKILTCKDNGEDKIPNSLNINVDPVVNQEVTNFQLGLGNYGKVTGNYAFVAPLALTSESKICYDKSWDDWGDEDMDKLTIRKAELTATVKSSIPASVSSETVAYLLGRDANGNTVSMKGSTTELKGLEPNQQPQEQQLVIKIDEGNPISRIYGMEIKVRATGSNGTLTPSQTIEVKDVKIKVSGYYEDEL